MVNSWVELVLTTPKVILHIYADFARGLTGCTRVTGVNEWVELVQSTTKVILHMFSESLGGGLD